MSLCLKQIPERKMICELRHALTPAQTVYTAQSLWDIYSSAAFRDFANVKLFQRLQSLLGLVPCASDLKHAHKNSLTEKLGHENNNIKKQTSTEISTIKKNLW